MRTWCLYVLPRAQLERLAAIVPTTKYLDAEIAEVHRMLGSAVTHADLAAAVERDNSTRTAAVTHGGDLQRKVATIEAELQAHKRHLAEMRDDLHAKVRRARALGPYRGPIAC